MGRAEERLKAAMDALAVVEPAFARGLERVGYPEPRGRPRLERWFDEWLRWMSDPSAPGGCLFVAASVELDDREGRPRDVLVGHQKELLRSLAKAADLAIGAGHFRPDLDCDLFAFEMHAIVLGASHARRLLREPRADERARAAFHRLLADAANLDRRSSS